MLKTSHYRSRFVAFCYFSLTLGKIILGLWEKGLMLNVLVFHNLSEKWRYRSRTCVLKTDRLAKPVLLNSYSIYTIYILVNIIL